MISVYTVKEAADILGVSVHTVRYYDDHGLVPGTKRNCANRRLFSDDELEWLFVSVTLRSTGLSVKETRRYIELYQQGDATIPERCALMESQRKKTLAEIENLQYRLKLLERKAEYYRRLMAGEKDEWSHEFMRDLIWKGRKQNDG